MTETFKNHEKLVHVRNESGYSDILNISYQGKQTSNMKNKISLVIKLSSLVMYVIFATCIILPRCLKWSLYQFNAKKNFTGGLKKIMEQAGAEMCQAQVKLEVVFEVEACHY